MLTYLFPQCSLQPLISSISPPYIRAFIDAFEANTDRLVFRADYAGPSIKDAIRQLLERYSQSAEMDSAGDIRDVLQLFLERRHVASGCYSTILNRIVETDPPLQRPQLEKVIEPIVPELCRWAVQYGIMAEVKTTLRVIMLAWTEQCFVPKPVGDSFCSIRYSIPADCCAQCNELSRFLQTEPRCIEFNNIGADKRKHLERPLEDYLASACTWRKLETRPQGLAVSSILSQAILLKNEWFLS